MSAATAKRPFLALLGKDARLSLDVVRPWAVAIVSGGLLLVLVTRLPESLVGGVSGTAISQVFRLLTAFLMVTAAPVTIVLSASIVQGDRIHGARVFSAVLPRGRLERGLSTTLAALAGAIFVAVASIGTSLASQALRPEDSALRWSNDFGWLGVALALAGGGIGLWIAPLVRRRWQATVLGCALLAGAATIGAIAARWMLPVVLPGLIGSTPPDQNEVWRLERLFSLAGNVGAIAGLCAAGAVGWLGGASGVLDRVRRIGASRRSVLATLLRKDLRLLVDGVLPSMAILTAFVLLALILLTTPGEWRPYFLRELRVAEFLAILAAALGIGAPILSGWWTASAVSGDRRHGAHALADSLPTPRAVRCAVRALVLLMALVAPALLSWLFHRAALAVEPQVMSRGLLVVPATLSLGLAAISVVTVGFAAQRLPSMFAAQLAGHLGILTIFAIAFVVAWLSFTVTCADILRLARHDASALAGALRLESSAQGAAVGTIVAAGVFGIAFVATILRARSTRWSRRAILLAIASAALLAAVATPMAARRSKMLETWPIWERRSALDSSNEDVAAGPVGVEKPTE